LEVALDVWQTQELSKRNFPCVRNATFRPHLNRTIAARRARTIGEVTEDAFQSFEEALAEWSTENDDAAALARLDEIATVRERQVTTRGLEEADQVSDELLRMISPDQFEPPLPPE